MAPDGYRARVPNQPATPNRTIRVPDDVWLTARRIAHDRDETLTEVIINALVRYIREHDH